MANEFRDHSPVRTCTKQYPNYRSYKAHLASDFRNKCGYTNCSDFWFGGTNNFHIDHFIPWKKHFLKNPALKTDYANLVYSCSFVNILKSDDDPVDYLDPCDVDYNKHFSRDSSGQIVPLTTSREANVMFKKLRLGLSRYRLIWMLDKLGISIELLKTKKLHITDETKLQEVTATLAELYQLHYEYITYLKAA